MFLILMNYIINLININILKYYLFNYKSDFIHLLEKIFEIILIDLLFWYLINTCFRLKRGGYSIE